MNDLKELIKEAINKSTEASDAFYQQKIADGNKAINETVNIISSCIDRISEEVKEFDVNTFLNNISEALKALESKDYVLLADILSYDVKEQLEAVYNSL